jgi:anti-sigma factor RsiW
MDCCDFEVKLSDYLDGLLARPCASRFRAHALQCRECRALLDEVRAALGDCKQEVEAPPMLEDALLMIPIENAPVDCFGFEELITEFLDGFVPASTYHRFEEHAGSCDRCSSLLNSVVYAVAACHSVHTYEEVEALDDLFDKLVGIMPEREPRLRERISNATRAIVAQMLPRPTQSAMWRVATAFSLALATFAFLLLSFSDDGSVKGILRQAEAKAGDIYDQGATLYEKTDEVMARFEEVGKGLGQILGGDADQSDGDKQHKQNSNVSHQP